MCRERSAASLERPKESAERLIGFSEGLSEPEERLEGSEERWARSMERSGGSRRHGSGAAPHPTASMTGPIGFLPAPLGRFVAKRLLERWRVDRPREVATEPFRVAEWYLALLGDDGAIDLTRAEALCEQGNALACVTGPGAAADYLAHAERACDLGLSKACSDLSYRLYLAVLDASYKTPAYLAHAREWQHLCCGGSGPDACRVDPRHFRLTCEERAVAPSGKGDYPQNRAPLVLATSEGPSDEDALKALQNAVCAATCETPELKRLRDLLCKVGQPARSGFQDSRLMTFVTYPPSAAAR